MAARKRTWTPDIVRRRIRASMLINRLRACALGTVEMSAEQVSAAKFLIERVVPRAEAPKQLNVSGSLTLEQLITGQIATDDDSVSASSLTH